MTPATISALKCLPKLEKFLLLYLKQEVADARPSGNMDSPEDGLGAIVQSLACAPEIGWREKSRKMIVFSTDAGLHLAGDGKVLIGLYF